MPEPICPLARWRPGANAGYASGRSSMRTVVCHYTVGRDSSAIGLDGYFHFLVARDGQIEQYAEADAVTWHAGEANGSGPGIEVEYYDEPTIFTPTARDACGALVRWLGGEWGFPLEYYDGPRIPPGSHRGFQSHRSVQQREGHSDYWPREDWDQMVAPAPTRPGRIIDMFTYTTPDKHVWMWGGGASVVITWDESQWYAANGVPYFGDYSWDLHERLNAGSEAITGHRLDGTHPTLTDIEYKIDDR